MLAAGLPFLLLPILTRYMSPAEFGLVGIFQGLHAIFLAICGLGIAGAIVRQSYDVDREGIGVYIYNALLILATTTAGLFLLLWFSDSFFSEWLKIPKSYFYYALISAATAFVLNILLGQLQVGQRPVQYGIFQVGHSLVSISLSATGVIIFSAGALGRVGGIVVAASFFGILALITLRLIGRVIIRVNTEDMRSALRFGVPLIPHELGTFMVNWLSLFVLNSMLDASRVGLYLLAFQVSMVLGVICDAFNKAYVPWLFSMLKTEQPENRILVVKLTYTYFALLTAIVALTFLISSWFVPIVFGASYAEASWMIGWLVLGQALGGAYLMVTNYIIYMRRTEGLSVITVSGSVVNIALLFALVPLLGITGAIAAFLAARAVILALTWFLAHRLVPMPWGCLWAKSIN